MNNVHLKKIISPFGLLFLFIPIMVSIFAYALLSYFGQEFIPITFTLENHDISSLNGVLPVRAG